MASADRSEQHGGYLDQRGMLMAGTLLSILPVMVLFFILQKEFIHFSRAIVAAAESPCYKFTYRAARWIGGDMSGTLPFRLEFSDYVLVEWTGEPSMENVQFAQRQVLEHSSFKKGMPVIVVDRNSTYNPSHADIQLLARNAGLHKDDLGPLALVVSSPLHRGIASMLRAYSRMEGLQCDVFQRLEDAVAWVREERSNPPSQQMQSKA